MQITKQQRERMKPMEGGREQEMDELWRDCGDPHNDTWLYQSYFSEEESVWSDELIEVRIWLGRKEKLRAANMHAEV